MLGGSIYRRYVSTAPHLSSLKTAARWFEPGSLDWFRWATIDLIQASRSSKWHNIECGNSWALKGYDGTEKTEGDSNGCRHEEHEEEVSDRREEGLGAAHVNHRALVHGQHCAASIRKRYKEHSMRICGTLIASTKEYFHKVYNAPIVVINCSIIQCYIIIRLVALAPASLFSFSDSLTTICFAV